MTLLIVYVYFMRRWQTMPNVEFFGLKGNLAYAKMHRLINLIGANPVLKDMVFTIHKETDVVDRNSEPRPFIRLTSTPREDLADIKKALETLELDVEVMLLNEFIPAKSK